MNRNDTRNSSGQSLVIIALLMIAMLGFLGLIIDGGEAYTARRRAQDAADSAAFAGVRKLAIRPDNSSTSEQDILQAIRVYAQVNRTATITDVVASYIDKNGNNICNLPCGSVPSSPLATGIRVTTTLKYDPFFISILIGNNQIAIPAIAAAQSGVPNVGTNLVPTSLPTPCNYDPNYPNAPCLQYNQVYTLTGDVQLPGGFQWVDYTGGATVNNVISYLVLDPNMAPVYVMADASDTYYNPSNPTQYNSPPPSPNPWIPSGPGVQPNSNIQDALNAWLDLSTCQQPNCIWGRATLPAGVTWGPKPPANEWIVPVYDHSNQQTGNNAKYHVVMFAAFQLQGYWFQNNQCNYIGAPRNPNCNRNLPAALQSCADANQKCIMGEFLRRVTDLPTVPGQCNANGIDMCAYGLTQ